MRILANNDFFNEIVFRLFYAGAVEGQMPEILSMIQVNKMTPAPAVLIVVRYIYFRFLSAIHYRLRIQVYSTLDCSLLI